MELTSGSSSPKSFWTWWICGLLLLASMINYMDRQTLSTASKQIKDDLKLTSEQYGILETGFALAFAGGSLFWGFLADSVSVRWLYPLVLVAWSAVGFATAYTTGFYDLLFCRILLGVFESGHWPCGLKTTQLLLESKDRTLGNSVLQSGTSIGAVLTPIVMLRLMTEDPGSWRWPFQVIGSIGLVWVALWLISLSWRPLPREQSTTADRGADGSSVTSATPWYSFFRDSRFWVLLVVVTCINGSWQIFRAWLPLFLQEGRGYSKEFAYYFNSVWYLCADLGCLGAGLLTIWLHRFGISTDRARLLVFLFASVVVSTGVLIPLLPAGWLLLVMLVVIGGALLAVFPCYYSLTQELTQRHMGKVTGFLSAGGWALGAPTQQMFGAVYDRIKSYDYSLAVACLPPLVAAVVLLTCWKSRDSQVSSANETSA